MASEPQRTIRISYQIVIPAGSTAQASSSSSVSSAVKSHGDISIVVTTAHGLPAALDAARAEMNDILSQWKNSIGELEKEKEAIAIRIAEENRRKARADRALTDTVTNANGAEEDEEDDDVDDAEP